MHKDNNQILDYLSLYKFTPMQILLVLILLRHYQIKLYKVKYSINTKLKSFYLMIILIFWLNIQYVHNNINIHFKNSFQMIKIES